MYPKRAGQRKAGGYGFHPCESKHVPGIRIFSVRDGKTRSVLERLDQFEEEGLEELENKVRSGKTGRKRRQKSKKPVRGDHRYDKKWISRTYPESGHLTRPGKPQGPHYLARQTVDCDHGIILDTVAISLPLSTMRKNDLYRCPQGKGLPLKGLAQVFSGLRWFYCLKHADCDACPARKICIGKGRTKHIERNFI